MQLLILGALLSVAAYYLVDKVAVGLMHPVVMVYMYPWISMGLYATYICGMKKQGRLKNQLAVHQPSILLCGILSIFGYFLIRVAFTLERVSYVVGRIQLCMVFAVMLGGQLLLGKK